MFQPGCWIDPAGRAHLFPDEVAAYLATIFPEAGFDPNSREDYNLIVEVYRQELAKAGIRAIEFVRHERKDVA
jgi:hypothetical protein